MFKLNRFPYIGKFGVGGGKRGGAGGCFIFITARL
jgi:hypothetical protein